MTNERHANRAAMIRNTSKIGFLLISAFFLTLSAATLSQANIHSPQGALDVASILPGRYAFLDAAKKKAPVPAPLKTVPAPQPSAQRDGDDNTADQPSIDELIGLMRQAAETSAIMAQEEPPAASRPAAIAQTIPGMNEALLIAARTPKYKAPDARALIQSRQLLWPVDGFIYSAFSATRGRRAHGAIDIIAEQGTPVAVAADGVVSVVANGGKNFSGYGKIVIVDHGQGVHTVYAHLDSFLVKMGQRVRKGQFIATVGHTGRCTTNLLHYEVRVAGRNVDPLTCMENRPGVVKMVNYKSGRKK